MRNTKRGRQFLTSFARENELSVNALEHRNEVAIFFRIRDDACARVRVRIAVHGYKTDGNVFWSLTSHARAVIARIHAHGIASGVGIVESDTVGIHLSVPFRCVFATELTLRL